RRELARAHSRRGIILDLWGRPAEAKKAHRAALALDEALVKEAPGEPTFRGDLAGTLHNLAMLARDAGDFHRAVRLVRRAIPPQRAAVRGRPSSPMPLRHLYNHLALLGAALMMQDENAAAVRTLREARKVALALGGTSAGSAAARDVLAESHANLG